ncbi:hypothetical protein D3C84_1237620 [compost metagenome]
MLAGAGFDLGGFAHNLFWVSLGNIVGGGGGVALVYWTIYLRPRIQTGEQSPSVADPQAAPPIAAEGSGR